MAMFTWNAHNRLAGGDDGGDAHKAVVHHWGESIDACAKYFPDAPRELFEELKAELKSIRANLAPHLHRGLLDDLGKRYTDVLAEFGKRIQGQMRRQDQEAREIVKLVGSMTETLGRQDKDYGVRFQNIAKKLKVLTTGTDLAEIKWQLAAEVEQLEKSVADMNRDTASALLRLQDSIVGHERQLPVVPASMPGMAELRAEAGKAVARRRFCVGLYLIDPVTEPALALLHSRCDVGDALEKTRQGEYIIVKDCTLLEMADEVGKVRQHLERMGITCRSGAAEMMKGEIKETVIGRARESAGATLARSR